MATARYYRADKNERGGSFPGVPLRDLEQDEFDRYPAWLQATIDASEMYQKTKPETATRSRKADDAAGEKES